MDDWLTGTDTVSDLATQRVVRQNRCPRSRSGTIEGLWAQEEICFFTQVCMNVLVCLPRISCTNDVR